MVNQGQMNSWLGFSWAALGALSAYSCLAAPAVTFKKQERVALVGGGFAERQGLYGNFEARLQARFPEQEVVVRNFGWPADEVGKQQRPNDYTKIDDPMLVFSPETFLCFFGYNESFVGPEGVAKFKADYATYLDQIGTKYGPEGRARFVLISPMAFENPGDPRLPDGTKENANLKLYTEAIRDVATERKLPFVDVFTPTLKFFAAEPGAQYTLAGFQANSAGDQLVGVLLDRELFGGPNPARLGPADFERLREAVVDKSWVHQQDYRMLNGWYVYGGRRTWDTETFPLEYKKIRAMAKVRDRFVWSIANGSVESGRPDDSTTGELFLPKTRFGVPQQSYSEPKDLRYLTPEESLEAMKVAEGFQVTLVASEREFPELAKPVQMNFDNRGRLWVSTMPTYPQWRPGDSRPTDKLVIFEDDNGDGKADRSKVFYDQLHCPTGFEFWNGGVLVMSQPRLLWLKDTDGDDKADLVVPLLDGWASDDTHHTYGAWEWSPGGLLHGLEGVAMSTTLETPWGPFRNSGTPGAYVFNPRSWKVRHFITPGYGNPWCYVFDFWGQGITGDGTTSQMHWDSPLSGQQKGPRKGLNAVFNNEGMRPALGSEFLYSRHLPPEVQGQYTYGCVINMNGLPRFAITNDGAGFGGLRVKTSDGKPDDLIASTDRNFRPGEVQIGPDGALWFLDWHNPLIGHMQYSQRDPNRDKVHGRLYRLTAKGRPLLQPVTQFGKSVTQLLEQLKEYEPRTRYRARRELRDRPTPEVTAAVKTWVAGLNPADPEFDRHRLEGLFVLTGHDAIDRGVLLGVLASKSRDARALGVRMLSDQSASFPDAFELLRPLAQDPDARVRLEVVRALSFFDTTEAVEVSLLATKQPTDYWLDYTLQHTLNALESRWKPALQRSELAKNNPEGRVWAERFAAGQPSLGEVENQLQKLIAGKEIAPEQRTKLVAAVGKSGGRAREGRMVYERVCTACHKVGEVGINYGPELTQVAARLKREELIESILYPNEKVALEWQTTNLTTRGGDELSGVVSVEDDQSVTLKLGGDLTQRVAKSEISKRETLQVSNMPEGLAAGLSTQEFLDLVEYLASLK